VLLVVMFAAGVIAYVLGERSAAEQDHRAQVGGTLLAAVLIVPPGVVWAWSRRRPPVQAVPSTAQTAAAAQALADRQAATWGRQVRVRGIRLPAPVKVRWRWADPQIAAPRDELGSAPGGVGEPGPVPGLEVGEVLGSGLVTRLHDEVYGRLRQGRLVLIGGPGAGKTAAMILLLLQALEHRDHLAVDQRGKVPVPVWLTLGSWNPAQELRAWVTATIARDHPYLHATVYGPGVIGALFDTGRVALFLDGLDEMPDAHRPQAIHRLQTEAGGLRVVLTSRPDEYQATLDDGGHLPASAVIELRPVGVGTAVDYLLADRTEPARRAWTQVTDRIRAHPSGVLAKTLNTPLTLSLARAAHPVDPTPLLDAVLDSEHALRRHLLDQTLVTAYPDPRQRAHATYWLGWIAHHMNTQPAGSTRDLPWWHIPTWAPRWQPGLVFGLGFGLGFGLWFGLWFGLGAGLVFGLVFGLFGLGFWLVFGLFGAIEPHASSVHRPSNRELLIMLRSGLGLGLVFGLVSGLVAGRVTGGIVAGLVAGLEAGGLGFVLGVGFVLLLTWISPVADSAEATPRRTHQQDAQHGLVFGLVFGLGFGLGIGPGGAYVFRFGLVFGLVSGLVAGLVFGLVFGGLVSVAGQLLVTEAVLAMRGRPVRFIRFLEAGVGRQVLRQAGTVYQFRHADLQDRLAERFAHDHLRAGVTAAPPGQGDRDRRWWT
jgi:hypothetical protein